LDIVALTIPHQHAPATRRQNPLLSVIAWEIYRLRASRVGIFAIISFGVFLLVMWLQRGTGTVAIQVAARTVYGGQIAYASTWDLLDKLGSGTVALLTIVLFFVCTDAVPRDLKTAHP
jgi:hypothetical protein